MTELSQLEERGLETLLRSYSHLSDTVRLMEANLRELNGGSGLPIVTFNAEASTFAIEPKVSDIDQAARIVSVDARRFKYDQKKRRIREAVDTLQSDEEKLLIAYRYFDGLGMQEVADKMNRSRSHAFSIRKSALTKLHDLLGEYASL